MTWKTLNFDLVPGDNTSNAGYIRSDATGTLTPDQIDGRDIARLDSGNDTGHSKLRLEMVDGSPIFGETTIYMTVGTEPETEMVWDGSAYMTFGGSSNFRIYFGTQVGNTLSVSLRYEVEATEPIDWAAVPVKIGTGTTTMLDLIKAHLNITDGSKDDELTQALNLAGDAVETYLDRVLAKRQTSEYFAHHFGSVVLHDFPVDTSEDVDVMLNGNSQTGYEAWLTTDKLAHLSRLGYSRDIPMDWRKFDQVVVSYVAGYDPFPSDLANAIMWTATDIYKSQGTGTAPGGASGDIKQLQIYDVGSVSYDVGSSSSSGGGLAATYPGVIPEVAAEVLTRYMRMTA